MEQTGSTHQGDPFNSRARAHNILFSGSHHSTGLIFQFTFVTLFLAASLANGNPSLIAQLSSENEFKRAKAAIALGQARDPHTVSDLAGRYAVESSKMVRLYILQALLEIDWEGKVSFFKNALSDSEADVRLKAAQLLQTFELTDSEPALVNALNDADLRVRAAAAVALGGESAKQTLVSLARSNDSQIKSQAILGLSTIHAQGSEVNTIIQNALLHTDPQVKSSAQWAADVLGIEAAP